MSPTNRHILIVDDEPNIRKLLSGVLEDEGYEVITAAEGAEARAVMAGRAIDLILLDVQLPGEDGLALLRRWKKENDTPPVVMMSGHATIDIAVQATRAGAVDFIEKPISVERLLVSIANGLRLRDLNRENVTLRETMRETMREAGMIGGEIIGTSDGIARLREEIARTAPSQARVLITGDNGTGKELVARALHTGSERCDRPFIKVNCAAIPSELLESELFGHERGAFTGAVAARRGKFELAQKGTLLLDEIGDMNPTTQAKLLRVLEEQEMERVGSERTIRLDVRIFASTNQNLEERIVAGDFRQDLYHRLKVVPIHVPPLRDRQGDAALLAQHYLDHFCSAMGRPGRGFSEDARQALDAYSWPGNVRELRNLMERLVIMSDEPEIGRMDIMPLLIGGTGIAGSDSIADNSRLVMAETLADKLTFFEKQTISQVVDQCEGNVAAAARKLGLDRANLHRKLKRLGLD
ncbi:MAG: sigma-54 dependent transcriptional regulator [Gemmatimonadales bacterium]|nr:sigma-54 dependent transcriptional regulator [Gemmatimonadales bacterium]